MWSRSPNRSPIRLKPPDVVPSHNIRRSIQSTVARFIRNGCFILATLASVVATEAQITISPASLSDGTTWTYYSQSFTADGGSGTYAWSDNGTLPGWLSLDTSSGTISGTPDSSGTYGFSLSVSDDGGNTWMWANYSITVYDPPPNNPPPLTISGSLTGGVTGGEYSQSLFASGGTGYYSWWVTSGSLPAGLSLGQYSGTISGTPTTAETSSFTVTLWDDVAVNSVSADYQITVYTPPSISGSLPGGVVNMAYSQTLAVEGGSGSYSWTLSGQPTGLDVDANGTISGTPSTAGTYYMTVTLTDLQSGGSAQAVYEIVIGPPPIAVSNISASAGTTDAMISFTMTMPYGGDSFSGNVYIGGVCYGSGSPDGNGSVTVSISGLQPNQSYSFEIQATGNIPGVGSCSVWDGAGGFQTGADSVLEFSAATYQANEGDGSVTITINRSGTCASAVSVDYSGDGEGTVTFDPWETSKTFTVPITNDDVFTGDATFTLVLSNPQGGAAVGSQSVAVLTIIENDSAPTPPEMPAQPADPTATVSMWDLRVDAVSDTTATISWAASADVPSGFYWFDSINWCWQGSWSSTSTVPDNNVVNYSGEGGSGSVAATYDGGSGRMVATITGLASGYNYNFTAESSCGGVSASAGGSFFAGTPPVIVPSITVANVTANNITSGGALISWDVACNCGDFYYILYFGTDSGSLSPSETGTSGGSACLSGLQPNQTYYYSVFVYAYDSSLNQYYTTSDVQSFTTPAPIHITSTPTVTPVSGNSVIVSWEVANGSGQTATHRVSVLAADGTEVASGETQSGDGAVSVQIDGLTPGYGYRYVVTSKINDDPGWSETVGNEGDPLTFTIAFTISNVAVNSDYTWVEGDTIHVCLNWQVEPAGVTSSHAVFRGDDTWVATGTEASDGSGWVTAL
ncbi:MAG: putative Ig domain-containing protein, partial [Verrucomicrobiia bacterium]